MNVGVLREIKDNEFRVALTPFGVKDLVGLGARVFVESGAGVGSGFSDEEYASAGAIVCSVRDVLDSCELILKIKEPVGVELDYFDHRHTIFTYFHFASNKVLTERMIASGANCIAYETVSDDRGGTPLLAPMSEVAGRMSVHVGAFYLAKSNGGSGVLLQGISGVSPGKVVILGGGVAGSSAAEVAVGMGASVVVLQRRGLTFDRLVERFAGVKNLRVVESTPENIEREVLSADLLVGAVYVVGEKASKLVSRDLVSRMKNGSVIVDIAIDQGGCVETSKPTTHSNPVFKVGGVTHYCVANMPGAFPRTSTFGITNVTLPFVKLMVSKGVVGALKENKFLRDGVNIWRGKLVNKGVALAHNLPFEELVL